MRDMLPCVTGRGQPPASQWARTHRVYYARRVGVLSRIVETKQAEIAALRGVPAPAPRPRRPSLDPYEVLHRPAGRPLALLAEIKPRSPSAGELSRALSPADRGRAYERAGAAGISVLTDAPFFGGSYADLAAVSDAVRVPTLCKDFVLDEVQLAHAAASGASLVLLIVRILPDALLAELVTAARRHHLAPLVEVATHDELARALSAGARIIGVNARDLDTLEMDRARAASVLAAIPDGRIAIHLSGLSSPEDVAAIAKGRADAALLGEALMRKDDPEPLLASLVAAAGGPAWPR